MSTPIACLDVAYAALAAAAACVVIDDWTASAPLFTRTAVAAAPVADYAPGELYKRELPLLLTVLAGLPALPATVVVDGYAWLDGGTRPGLGARLHACLGGVPVIGVAKTRFGGDTWSVPVLRGASARPLFVTAAGLDQAAAAAHVMAMHGANRLPTILALADRLARDRLADAGAGD